jgi:hypothetical protein
LHCALFEGTAKHCSVAAAKYKKLNDDAHDYMRDNPPKPIVLNISDWKHWSTASPIRTIFRDAFEAADLPYFNPHSFRKTLVTLGQKLCQSPEEFKSWSHNLGQDDVLTTLYNYGHVQQHQQGEIFQQLKFPRSSANQNVDDIARAVVKAMANQNSQIGV